MKFKNAHKSRDTATLKYYHFIYFFKAFIFLNCFDLNIVSMYYVYCIIICLSRSTFMYIDADPKFT